MLKFELSDKNIGTGISKGLARGLLVYYKDVLLLEEGMGLGICALHVNGHTYFTSPVSIAGTRDSFESVWCFDIMLETEIVGFKTPLVTFLREHIITGLYMKQKSMQEKLLEMGERLRKIFRMETCFVKVPPVGEVRANYKIFQNSIKVDLSFELKKQGGKLYILNELGGNIFDRSLFNDEIKEPLTGWEKAQGKCELYSSIYGLSFSVREDQIPENVSSSLFWGRENIGDVCWAGFEIELICDSGKINHFTYSIIFSEVPG